MKVFTNAPVSGTKICLRFRLSQRNAQAFDRSTDTVLTQCDYYSEVSISFVVNMEIHLIVLNHFPKNPLYQIGLMLRPCFQFVVFYILKTFICEAKLLNNQT